MIISLLCYSSLFNIPIAKKKKKNGSEIIPKTFIRINIDLEKEEIIFIEKCFLALRQEEQEHGKW